MRQCCSVRAGPVKFVQQEAEEVGEVWRGEVAEELAEEVGEEVAEEVG